MKLQIGLLVGAVLGVGVLVPAPLLPQVASSGSDTDSPVIEIAFEKFVLENGLTLIVHEDRKAPIVAVNVWYHVGSKNEKPGKTGFAHLFEHLMFEGSEHNNRNFWQTVSPLGVTDANGTTDEDRTNYFENIPTSGLDAILWLESDRMGHLLGVVDSARLAQEVGVVQNEKRENYDNAPYGRVWENIAANTYPAGHPYSWLTIGQLEDLEAASLEDVQNWFRTYYGAANAVLSLAGDIDPQTAYRKVVQYFGHIPSGPPLAGQRDWVAKMTGEHRGILQDRVPQARLYLTWNVPAWGTPEADYLDLVSDVLSDGKTSRLYRRLVYDEELATQVSASISKLEIGGQFQVVATAREGVSLGEVESAVREELAHFVADGPTALELQRVKTQHRARFIRGAERIGGFGGKSDILAEGEVYAGDPAAYRVTLDRVESATAADLKSAAAEWLSDGVYVLEVTPFPEYSNSEPQADRTAMPEVGAPPEARFPSFERAVLSNGMKILFAERRSVPQVTMSMMFDAGTAADQFARPGTANLAMGMMDEGTSSRSALEISEQLALLGASVGAGSNLDMSAVGLTTLTENLAASLEIYADIMLNPSFPADELERQRRQLLARIEQEKAQPVGMALRAFPGVLYGEGHAYGNPLTGSGTVEAVNEITRDDLQRYHDTWIRPNNATLVVVGATTLAELTPKLERLFRDWEPRDVPQKNISTVAGGSGPEVYILHRPGAAQSLIFAGSLAPPKANPREIPIEALVNVFGGGSTGRLNKNLRVDKHWSYGAFAFAWPAVGQRPFIIYASVQADKTDSAMAEIQSEMANILGDRPVTAEDLADTKQQLTLTLPGDWETMGSVLGSLGQIVRFGLPDDYFQSYASDIRGVTLEDIESAADDVIKPSELVWVVVGDREAIEPGIRALGFENVQTLTLD